MPRSIQDLPISPTIESVFKVGFLAHKFLLKDWYTTPSKRLPKLYTNDSDAITCYRKYLTQVDARLAPHVKARLAHDCATLLLLTSTKSNYVPLSKKGQKGDIFVPETIEQEAYLLLLIADTLHEYVIDRAAEYDKVSFVNL